LILDSGHVSSPDKSADRPASPEHGDAVAGGGPPSERSLGNSGLSARVPDQIVEFEVSVLAHRSPAPDSSGVDVRETLWNVPSKAQDLNEAGTPLPLNMLSDDQGEALPQRAHPGPDQPSQEPVQIRKARPHEAALVGEARGYNWASGAMVSLVDTARDSARTAVRIDVYCAADEPEDEALADYVQSQECDLDDSQTALGQEHFLVSRDDGPGLDGNGMRRRLAAGTADAPPVPAPSASSPLSATPWLAACFRIGRGVCVLSKTAPSLQMHWACLSQHGDRSLDGLSGSHLGNGGRDASRHVALLSRTAIADGSLNGAVVVDWDSKDIGSADVADLVTYSPWNRVEEIDNGFSFDRGMRGLCRSF
jgi:hypothetical protein